MILENGSLTDLREIRVDCVPIPGTRPVGERTVNVAVLKAGERAAFPVRLLANAAHRGKAMCAFRAVVTPAPGDSSVVAAAGVAQGPISVHGFRMLNVLRAQDFISLKP